MERYTAAQGEGLREDVITLRNYALEQSDFDWAVLLSHVIAFMAQSIEQLKQAEEATDAASQ